jgi:hypothetical protein
MKLGFDILRRLDDGSPLWVAKANSIAETRARLVALRQFSPGHCFVRAAETGQPMGADLASIPREMHKRPRNEESRPKMIDRAPS